MNTFSSVVKKFTRQQSKYFALFYKYIPDILEKRAPIRPKHFEHIKNYENNGKLLLGGAFNPPTDGAVIIFRAEREEIEEFAKTDPYVLNKLVTSYEIKEWTVVAGALADPKVKL